MNVRRLGVALMAVFGACAGPVDAPAPAARSALEGHFEAAAREYQVPVELLKGIAWVETRVSVTANLESASGGLGLMQLPEHGDWKLQQRAQALTGATRGQLAVDPAANVRGAAAVLRELFDRTQRDEPGLDARAAGDWFRALALYPGFESADAAHEWAADVYRAIARGFSAPQPDGVVTQAPTWTGWERHAPTVQTRRDALGDYPGRATYVQSPHRSSGRSSYEFIVIHTMQGSYAGSRSWFLNPSSNVSAHYLVRSSDGEITQMVAHADTAWHAQCYNGRSIGIEHEGFVQDPARWYTDAMYTESAKLTRYIADRHGIPKNRTRIIGHVEVAPSCNTGRHSDPGSGWNWTRYMNLVNGAGPTPGSGTLIGVIYQGGSTTNRVSGATVTVAGQSATTGADGLYQFTLAPGAYTVSVSKAGFSSNSVSRTVTAGAQAWGSMEVNPMAAANGTLRGKVYVFNAANPSDLSQGVPGATVTVNGQTVTADGSGNWLFMLAPGTYTVTAAAQGFQSAQVSRTVTSGATTWGSIGVTATSMPDRQPPELMFTAPTASAMLDVGMVTVTGTASDDRGAVAEVRLALNGAAEQRVPVMAGRFSVDVLLKPGTNTLVAKATDGAGNEGTATVTASFLAGVRGTVTRAGDGAVPIEGATVELREAASGTMVSTATSAADGTYTLAVGQVPADYLLVAKATGFRTASETVSVPEDRRVTVDVALMPGEDMPGEASVRFLEPMDGAEVMTDSVTVYGQVVGFDVAGVQVNGVTAELVGAGGFSATVPLMEGENALTATASGIAGESAVGRLTVKYAKAPGSGLAPVDPKKGVAGGCGCQGASAAWPVVVLAVALVRRRRRPAGQGGLPV
ncbi:MAG: N-acetylmuramoyl-L-alanine amidase [Myxococcaceae bacterium]|nr:N-acetylmuramoyl-L-alanine amidase [Myxococcaceae bacterium]